ncbi:MAG: M20/M25/M40 family metallo-hydrolase [Candidatus Thiodiazotropha sp. (ex Dulcina madagascariensis)]|nr:M20/M25/M40 family metallo-hydrolase [Candidatus Thiodiazotropha sp. (ex Dulcina madagascariensis)]
MSKGLIITVFFLSLISSISSFADSQSESEAALLSHIRQLTFEGRRAGEGYFNADGSRMIFQSERDDANPFYQIYLMDLETGDVDRLSPGYGKTTCAWIHPSNDKVLYASTHDDPEAKRKMQEELDFRASGSERRYSWDYDENFDIYEQTVVSGQRKNLTATLGYDAEGAYSPDGGLIVFASNRRAYTGEMSDAEKEIFKHDKSFMMDLYLMRADGSDLRQLTDSPGYDGGPFFSFDGGKITWRRFSPDGSRAEIYTMDLATGKEKQLTRMGVMSWAPFFHPSGDYLIFASNREGFANFELFLVDAQGKREPVRVTHTMGFDGLPVFSPNGRQLSWTSKRGAGKKSQIFLADWNDTEARRLLGLDGANTANAMFEAEASLATTADAIRREDLRLHVHRLADDEMEGRLTGTRGEQRATRYVAAVFQQLGLEPGGDDAGFFQPFAFTAGAKLGEENRLTISGISQPEPLTLHRDWRPLALSRSGRVEATDIVFAGYGIDAPGSDKVPDYDSYGALDVADKWVMVFRFQPESVPPEWRRHLLHYSDLAYKASVAKRRGALGLIVVTGPGAEAKQRLIDLQMDEMSATTSIAGISVSDDLASRIVASAGKDLEQLQKQLDKGEVTVGFALPGIGLAASLDIVREKRQGRNVIARLAADDPSGRPPVLLGAHLDHLGHGEVSGSLAREEERGEVHHGADDNASGVAALLESAQYLAGLKRLGKLGVKRDILFIAWSGEELGTLGSSHFVDQLAGSGYLRGKVSAYLNMDMVGHLREKVYIQGTGSSSRWSREIEQRNVPVGLSIATKADPYLPTDSTPFYMKGVPVLNAFTGAHEDYSTPRDRAEQLNYEGIRDIARLMAGITRSLARAEKEPDYLEVMREKSGLSRKHLRAYLGTIPSYGQDEETKGVRLQGAVKGAPAEKAGVKDGDILVALAGVDIETIHDFMNALAGLKAGEETEMTVIRGGKAISLSIVPASRE